MKKKMSIIIGSVQQHEAQIVMNNMKTTFKVKRGFMEDLVLLFI